MAAKQIAYDNDAREQILRGIQKLAKAVKVTLGPSGRVVILEKSFGAPTVTKDGVSVAKEIELADPYENMGDIPALYREYERSTSSEIVAPFDSASRAALLTRSGSRRSGSNALTAV